MSEPTMYDQLKITMKSYSIYLRRRQSTYSTLVVLQVERLLRQIRIMPQMQWKELFRRSRLGVKLMDN
jgi:hypothetical protein